MGEQPSSQVEQFAWVDWDLAGVIAETTRYAGQVADLVDSAAGREGDPVPGMDWTVGQLATHLAAVAVFYEKYFNGTESYGYDVTALTESNERFMAEYGNRDCAEMATDIRTSYAGMIAVADGLQALDRLPWHAGPMPVAAVMGVGLNELVLHGRDLAAALGRPWQITPDAARHGIRAALAVAPHVVNLELAAQKPTTYRVYVPGVVTSEWRFDNQGLQISARGTNARVSCSTRIEPRTMLLVAYGRTTALRAALTAKALSWGRRPLASLNLANYVHVR